jgi:hypothetical protein
VDHIDAVLTGFPGGIASGRHRKVALELLRERRALQDSINRALGQVGLERVARPVATPWEIAAQINAEKEAAGAGSGKGETS